MIRTVVDEGVDVVLLDRPATRNALTAAMWRDLAEAVTRLDRAPTDAPVVLRGADGYFSSGADLAALAHARTDRHRAAAFTTAVVGALLALHRARRRTVALVDTGAAGGGVEIMLACDVRVTTGPVGLVFPFGGHGVSLDGFTAWRLTGLVGARDAARLTDGVHRVPDAEVRRLGLVDATVTGPAAAADLARGRPAAHRWPGLAGGEVAAASRAAAPMVASLLPGPAPVDPPAGIR